MKRGGIVERTASFLPYGLKTVLGYEYKKHVYFRYLKQRFGVRFRPGNPGPLAPPELIKTEALMNADLIAFYQKALALVRNSRLRELRQLEYDTLAPHCGFLLASAGREKFIVQANDQFISRGLYVDGEFDLDKLSTALRIAGRDFNTLVDIGANIGSICIPAVKRGWVGSAIAVEPEPTNYRILAANVHLNDVAKAICILNVALGNKDGEILELELAVDNKGDHRIFVVNEPGRHGEACRQRLPVQVRTLDAILENVDLESTLLWIDTQGYEGLILEGASNVCGRKVPAVLEFWPYGMKRARSYQALKNALKGYSQFYDLNKDRPSPVALSDESLDILYEALGEDENFTDILVV
jgi:FkbM family methyltransferase